MELNGYDYVVKRFVLEMENIAVYVASNVVGKDLLREVIASLLYEEDYSESLKLALIDAISRHPLISKALPCFAQKVLGFASIIKISFRKTRYRNLF